MIRNENFATILTPNTNFDQTLRSLGIPCFPVLVHLSECCQARSQSRLINYCNLGKLLSQEKHPSFLQDFWRIFTICIMISFWQTGNFRMMTAFCDIFSCCRWSETTNFRSWICKKTFSAFLSIPERTNSSCTKQHRTSANTQQAVCELTARDHILHGSLPQRRRTLFVNG